MLSGILHALAGGVLIGLAAGVFFLINGRILGISGLAAGLLGWRSGQRLENGLFFLGLLAGAALVAGPGMPLALVSSGRLVVAGLLVGVGVRLANGCTSGHAVCGLARGGRRSIAATAVFMAVAMAVVAVGRVL
ncbi:MAG: YeeE/YedE family protein [Telmatospirillum sp.]|nr:YeeE/YedE family protein [Telmatospirillum sp.]